MASTLDLLRNKREKRFKWTMIVIGVLLWIVIAQVTYNHWNDPKAGRVLPIYVGYGVAFATCTADETAPRHFFNSNDWLIMS